MEKERPCFGSWRANYPETSYPPILVAPLTPNDIKMGRGADVFVQPGNTRLRTLCIAFAQKYAKDASRQKKSMIAHHILDTLWEENCRFVREIKVNGKPAWALEVAARITDKVRGKTHSLDLLYTFGRSL